LHALLPHHLTAVLLQNWPWFKPVLYHDISAEVPAWNRSMVRFAYLGWLLAAAGFLVNWIVAMILYAPSLRLPPPALPACLCTCLVAAWILCGLPLQLQACPVLAQARGSTFTLPPVALAQDVCPHQDGR
jgi:hypothetical protein